MERKWAGAEPLFVSGGSRRRAAGRYASLAVTVAGLVAVPAAKADTAAVSATVQQVSGSVYAYQYTVSGTFAANDVLAIYFPVATSGSLADESVTSADWTTSVLQPDSSLPADGELDLLANVANPGLQQMFAAQFAYSGSGMPGAQSFTLYDGDFNVLQMGGTTTGLTTPGAGMAPVPEPGTLALLGSGGMGILGIRRRRLRS